MCKNPHNLIITEGKCCTIWRKLCICLSLLVSILFFSEQLLLRVLFILQNKNCQFYCNEPRNINAFGVIAASFTRLMPLSAKMRFSVGYQEVFKSTCLHSHKTYLWKMLFKLFTLTFCTSLRVKRHHFLARTQLATFINSPRRDCLRPAYASRVQRRRASPAPSVFACSSS